MAVVILIIAVWIFFALAKSGNRVLEERKHQKHRERQLTSTENERRNTQAQIDELITVILPTINNDK